MAERQGLDVERGPRLSGGRPESEPEIAGAPGASEGSPPGQAAPAGADAADERRTPPPAAPQQPCIPQPPSVQDNGGADEEEMPRVHITREQAIAFGVFVLSVVAFLYFVLPKISGIGSTFHRIEGGNVWWVGVGVLLEILSFGGYVALFRAVFARGYERRLGMTESYQITMAGLAASRLFAAGGAGGIALTAWALRRSGMQARIVACRMTAFLVLLYSIFAGSMLIDGIGLGTGLFPGGGSFAITFVPAIIAALLFALFGAVALLPDDIERRLAQWASGSGRIARWVALAVTAPALAASGVRTALSLARTRDPRLLGAPAWWGFDMCVLWASFHAFGSPPPFTVIWMCYFIGMLGNLLPLPGGVGGVDGAMIGALAAFGVDFNLAVVSVLLYRAIAFWLPSLPGAVAYLQLARKVRTWRGQAGAEKEPVTDGVDASEALHA